MNDNTVVREAVQENRVYQAVGSWEADETGGLTVKEIGDNDAWIWTDSPTKAFR